MNYVKQYPKEYKMAKKPRKAVTFKELSQITGMSIQTLRNKSTKGEFSIWDRPSILKFLAKQLAIKAIEQL